jgi:hypothetical protein
VPTDIDWAYAAGILDGEGCIHIAHYKSNYGQFVLRVTIGNTSVALLEWLTARFGGSWCASIKPKPGYTQCYSWKAQSRMALAFIEGCLPYLIVKRVEAEVAIRFYSERPPHHAGSRKPTPAAEWERRRELRVELQRLKGNAQRNRVDVPSRAVI